MDLDEKRSLEEILKSEAGDGHVVVVEGESAATAGYVPLLSELDRALGGALAIKSTKVTDAAPPTSGGSAPAPQRSIALATASGSETLTVAGKTSWIDAEVLVEQLNAILEKRGKTERLYTFFSRDYDAECGFVVLDEAKGAKISELVRARAESGGPETFWPDGRRKAVAAR